MKSMWGNYRTFVKDFNDDRHMNNWVNLMIKKGHKIIGVQPQYMNIAKHRREMQLEHHHAKAKERRKFNL
jgi:hypothetical protein